MNVSNIPFSLLPLEAIHEMTTQCEVTILKKHAEDPLLKAPLAALQDPWKRATLAIGSSRKQELTSTSSVPIRPWK